MTQHHVNGSAPLRIGIDGRFLQDKFDGVGRYANGLLRGLRDADGDHLVRVFIDPSLPNRRFPFSDLVEPGRLELCPVSTPLYSVRELSAWPARLWRKPVDVFHSPYFWSPLVLPCPLVATVHDMIFDRYPEYIPGLRYLAPYWLSSRLALRRASSVIAVSEATRRDILHYSSTNTDKIVTIPNAVEERYQPARFTEDRSRVRARYGLPEAYVLAVGARRPHKNFDRLVSAFSKLTCRVEQSLVLVGTVDRRFDYGSQADVVRLRREGRVLELDNVEEADLPVVYSMADLFVQPSIIEGFGLPVLEAMACGCPVACSNTSSLPEVAGDAALLFDPLSEVQIVAAMHYALTSPRLRCELRQRGLSRARRFTWLSVAERTLQVYRHVAGRNGLEREP